MPTLTFDVFWRDRGASKGLQGLGKDAENSRKHVETLSSHGKQLAAGFAGFAAARIFDSFISGARESNLISRVTEQRIRSTGGAAHITANQVGDLATAISNKTGADDEAVQSGENMLLTFTSIRNEVGRGNDIFNQATAAATDLAAGLNQGQVTAEGTQQAAVLLGKALNDPIAGMTALRRVGISFTASQVSQIKALQQSGQTLQAQKVILGEVNREFGGTARAAADPLQRMSVILGNVGEDIGNKLLPALNEAADILSAIPEPVYTVGAALVTLGVGAIGVSKGINAVRDIAQGTAGVMRLLGLRTTEAAAAETAQAVAARESAVSTAASGDAAAAASTKFGALAGKGFLVGAAAGLSYLGIQAADWVSSASVARGETGKLADSLKHLNDTGGSATFRHLFDRAGIGGFAIDAQTSAEALDQFESAARDAFGSAWTDRAQRLLSFGVSAKKANEQIDQLDGGLAQLARSGNLGAAQDAFHTLAQRMRAAGVAESDIAKAFPQYTAAAQDAIDTTIHGQRAFGLMAGQGRDEGVALQGVGAAAKVAAHGMALAADANHDGAVSATEAHAAQLKLLDDLQKLSDRTLTLRGADRELAGAQDDLTASIRTNGRTLSDNTSKGRANGDALDRVAKATLGSLQAHRDSGEPLRQYARRVKESTDKLADEAVKAGMTRTAARKYADAILAVPRKQTTAYTTPGLNAARKGAQGLAADIRALQSKTVKVRINSDGSFTQAYTTAGGSRGSRTGMARGGRVTGGVPGQDSVPALLTPDEHVWTTSEVAGAGGHAAVGRLRKLAAAGMLAAFAEGGAVSRRATAAYSARLPAPGSLQAGLSRSLLWAAENSAAAVPNVGGSGVARWAPVILQVLRMLHQSSAWLSTVEARMQRESGGNPTIVNKWDSNWRAGTPSVGAMQVIGPTFRAYAGPFRSTGPFEYGVSTNVKANTYAGLNYALHRYGNLAALARAGGYDTGGVAHGSGWIPKPTRAPERVLSARQTVAFEQLVPLLGRTGGAVVHNHFDIRLDASAAAFEDKIVRTIDHATRVGRLPRR